MSRRYTGFPPAIKEMVRVRADNRCEVCGEHSSDCTWHHRRCRGMGSTRRPETNGAANSLLVCGLCHHRIETNRAFAFDQGWLVRQAHDPADVPVVRRGRLVWLDDLGGIEAAA